MDEWNVGEGEDTIVFLHPVKPAWALQSVEVM